MRPTMNALSSLTIVATFLLSPVAAAEPTVDDFVNHYRPLLGDWKVKLDVGGEKQIGKARWELAKNEKCLLISVEFEKRPAVQALIAFNPVTKKSTQTSVDADGMLGVASVELPNLKPNSTMSKGTIGKWEATRYKPDGTTTKATETLKCLQADKDCFVFVWADRTENGESLPDFKLTYYRD